MSDVLVLFVPKNPTVLNIMCASKLAKNWQYTPILRDSPILQVPTRLIWIHMFNCLGQALYRELRMRHNFIHFIAHPPVVVHELLPSNHKFFLYMISTVSMQSFHILSFVGDIPSGCKFQYHVLPCCFSSMCGASISSDWLAIDCWYPPVAIPKIHENPMLVNTHKSHSLLPKSQRVFSKNSIIWVAPFLIYSD